MRSDKKPEHIAIIMDGNGRWAKKRLLPRSAGHREGVKTIDKMAEIIFGKGIKYLTVFAFSTENWKRPDDEINGLVDLLKKYIKKNLPKLIQKNISFKVYGDISRFDEETKSLIKEAESATESLKSGVLGICFNYGGRAEIVNAARLLAGRGELITEKSLSDNMYTKGAPDPDIVIRTGGEKRISNFLLYQMAYSELYFTDTLWPDFDEKELDGILARYMETERRYGSIKE